MHTSSTLPACTQLPLPNASTLILLDFQSSHINYQLRPPYSMLDPLHRIARSNINLGINQHDYSHSAQHVNQHDAKHAVAFAECQIHSILPALPAAISNAQHTDPIRMHRIARSVPHHERYEIRGNTSIYATLLRVRSIRSLLESQTS